MALNVSASNDARYARTGKDAAIYDGDGNLLATVESFQAQVNYSNAKYTVLGDPQEHETESSYGITIALSNVVIETDAFITQLIDAMSGDKEYPRWKLQGSIKGRNNSEERIVYPECIPSGNADIQNLAVGDTMKRQLNLFCNGKPTINSSLTTA